MIVCVGPQYSTIGALSAIIKRTHCRSSRRHDSICPSAVFDQAKSLTNCWKDVICGGTGSRVQSRLTPMPTLIEHTIFTYLLPSLLSATPYTILAEKELSLLAREFLPRICLLELRCTPPLMLSSSLEDGQDFYRQSTRCRNRP